MAALEKIRRKQKQKRQQRSKQNKEKKTEKQVESRPKSFFVIPPFKKESAERPL